MAPERTRLDELIEKVKAISPAILTEVIRQDQRSASFKVTEWSVHTLSDKGIMNPEGLFLFSGMGRDEQSTRPWSVVLKVANDPGQEQDPQFTWYWKREMLVAQSGILNTLPDSIVGPRFYGVTELETGGWIWMEHIKEDVPGLWTFDQYAFAARQMGRWHGVYLTGTPLPDFQWLGKDWIRPWIGEDAPDGSWESPFIRQFFNPNVRARVKDLWSQRERFLKVLNSLPQVFSHFDLNRLNLFIRKQINRPNELVVIDWAMCGFGAAGADLYSLTGMTPALFVIDPSLISDLDKVTFQSYLLGLRDVGWDGNPDLIRLGFCACIALWLGIGTLGPTVYWTSEEARSRMLQRFDNRSAEILASGWASLCEFSLDRGDEARMLMAKLNL